MNPIINVIPLSDQCGPATAKARGFGQQVDTLRRDLSLEHLSRSDSTEIDGVNYFLTANSSNLGTTVTIITTSSTNGFICKPRIQDKNGGWTFGKSPIQELGNTGDVYPLRHYDQTSTAIIQDENNDYARTFELQEFGNVDWKGIRLSATDLPDDTPVLTWKGPSGRSIPHDDSVSIDGLTTVDIDLSGGIGEDKFTCFGSVIYSGGKALNKVPAGTRMKNGVAQLADMEPKILGCALHRETKDKTSRPFYWLVACVNTHYQDILGFFDEIWYTRADVTTLYDAKTNPYGWRRMTLAATGSAGTVITDNARPAGRPIECWFFNQSGTACTQGLSEWRIDWQQSPPVATLQVEQRQNATLTYHQDPVTGNATFTYAGKSAWYSDYAGDQRVVCSTRIEGTTKKTNSGRGSYSEETDAPIYMLKPEAYGTWDGSWDEQKLQRATTTRKMSKHSGREVAFEHTKNRITTLESTNGLSLIINRRTRNFRYHQDAGMNSSNCRWLGTIVLYAVEYTPFFDYTTYSSAAMKESYQTCDVIMHYLDLRNNTVAYNEINRDMTYDWTSTTEIPFKTTWGYTTLYAFIKEDVPIWHSERFIVQSGKDRVYVYRADNQRRGWWNGIRLCMPDFLTEMEPRPVGFTYDGIYYPNAADIDWYWQYAHWQHDGDFFLFYADWIEYVGLDNTLDAEEARLMYEDATALAPKHHAETPAVIMPITSPIFTGSVGVGLSGDVFYSVAYVDPVTTNTLVKNGFLRAPAVTSGTPETFFSITLPNSAVINKPVNTPKEGSTKQIPTIFYPIAPVQAAPL